MELMSAMAHSHETGVPISQVCINWSQNEWFSGNAFNYVSALFEMPFPVREMAGSFKQKVWTREKFKQLMRNYKRVASELPLRNHEALGTPWRLLMVRVAESSPVSVEQYERLQCNGVQIIGDNAGVCESVAQAQNGEFIGTDPVINWMRCVAAEEIVAPPTSFVFSALLFDPQKRVRLLAAQDGRKPFPEPQMVLMREHQVEFPNLEWV